MWTGRVSVVQRESSMAAVPPPHCTELVLMLLLQSFRPIRAFCSVRFLLLLLFSLSVVIQDVVDLFG